MFIRFVYFIGIGWWFGLLATLLANLLLVTIIGIPFGVIILNRLPSIVFMREAGELCPEGFEHRHPAEEFPFILRAVWFLVIGWELSFLTILVAYVCGITVVGIPLCIWLLNRIPVVTTLSRHYG